MSSARSRLAIVAVTAWYVLVVTDTVFVVLDRTHPLRKLATGEEFPCANRSCCCRTAAQCQTRCCCFPAGKAPTASSTRMPVERGKQAAGVSYLEASRCAGGVPGRALSPSPPLGPHLIEFVPISSPAAPPRPVP